MAGDKVRRGKKKSSNRIQDQMEFYFSNSNLRRDRFIREKLFELAPQNVVTEEDDGSDGKEMRLGLDLSLFLNFNNIKSLTSDVSVLKDSLVRSKSLSVYQAVEGGQLLVARKDWATLSNLSDFLVELDGNNQEFDKRTIYCENLPLHASQQWLRQIFSQFGQINLVSVPKFKGNQRIKQFCFVEFAEEATMPAVLEYFRQFNGVLCYDETQSDHLQSIQTFQEEEAGEGKKKKRKKEEEDQEEEAVGEGDTSIEEAEKAQPSKELNDNMIHDLKIMPK